MLTLSASVSDTGSLVRIRIELFSLSPDPDKSRVRFLKIRICKKTSLVGTVPEQVPVIHLNVSMVRRSHKVGRRLLSKKCSP